VIPILGAPVQIAYAVRDVRVAARWWAATFGAGPFFVIDHIALSEVRYRGTPSAFDHSSAYGQWGSVMVELVCDHTIGPSPVADVVGFGGQGLHHMAYFVDDLAVAQAELVAAGWPEALHAVTPSGMAFAFHDAAADLGHMIELYEPVDALVGFYKRVADAALGWDGTDPIRSR
jgi:catechol 2,3-dioxygenase-like lactoylglutathione lyase family enzyme